MTLASHHGWARSCRGGARGGAVPCWPLPRTVVARRSRRCLAPRAYDFDALSSTEFDSFSSMDEAEWEDNLVRWAGGASPRVRAPPGAPPIVILPGFGNCTEDYTAPFGQQEASLVAALEARGFRVYVLPLERKDWFRVVRGLFTLGFWSSSLTTSPGYTWYLQRVDETVKRALEETGADKVDLIGHSAGGWLGRAYIADPAFFPADPSSDDSAGSQTEGLGLLARLTAALPSMPPMLLTLPGSSGGASASASSEDVSTDVGSGGSGSGDESAPPLPLPPHNPRVRALVTLGSPQRAAPPDKGRDMTGGALTWVHATYPGAFFAPAGVHYVSVGGRTVRGRRRPEDSAKGPRTPPQYAYDSYQQVCGDGQDVEGDAVVPAACAFLGGAQHQVLLDGVWHSMSRIGTFEEDSGEVWYGSEQVVDSWLWALHSSQGAPSSARAASLEAA